MGRCGLMLIFALFPMWMSAQLPPCKSVRVGVGCAGADSIRGPWEMRGSDVFFEIVPAADADGFDFVVLDSFDTSVGSGQVKGSLTPLADDHKFDLTLEQVVPGKKSKPVKAFIATFDAGWHRLSLHAYNRHRSLTLDRLFPYIFRLGFSNSNPRPNDVDGAVNLNLPRRDRDIVL